MKDLLWSFLFVLVLLLFLLHSENIWSITKTFLSFYCITRGIFSLSHDMGVLSRPRRILSCSQGFHAQEQKGEAARVWAQEVGFFNCSSGVADRTRLWGLLLLGWKHMNFSVRPTQKGFVLQEANSHTQLPCFAAALGKLWQILVCRL